MKKFMSLLVVCGALVGLAENCKADDYQLNAYASTVSIQKTFIGAGPEAIVTITTSHWFDYVNNTNMDVVSYNDVHSTRIASAGQNGAYLTQESTGWYISPETQLQSSHLYNSGVWFIYGNTYARSLSFGVTAIKSCLDSFIL